MREEPIIDIGLQLLYDNNTPIGVVPEGAKTTIVAFLERALALLSDDNTRNDASAFNMVGAAFVERVDADERRGILTAGQAGDLRIQAEDIRNMLGCRS
jgi:hypothetical protein